MRRIAGFCMAAAVLALAVGCGKKGSTDSGGSGSPSASDNIEGTYLIVGIEAGGEALPADLITKGPEAERTVTITSDKFIGSKNGKEDPATYKLDASKNPKEIDLTAKKTTSSSKGGKGAKAKEEDEKMYGIYKVEGDKLIICMAESDKSADRPKEFKTTKDNKVMMMTLQKKK